MGNGSGEVGINAWARFLALAVFLGILGLATGCTYSKHYLLIDAAGHKGDATEPSAAPAPKSSEGGDEVVAPEGNGTAGSTTDGTAIDGHTTDGGTTGETGSGDATTGGTGAGDTTTGGATVGPTTGSGNGNDTPETPTPVTSKPGLNGLLGHLGNPHILADDSAPPQVELGGNLDGDAQTFAVVFNEPVDFQSIKDKTSVALYDEGVYFPTPVAGTLIKDDNQIHPKVVKFVADAPLKYHRDSNGAPLTTIYTLRVFGADSADASRAVKDIAGNVMAHEYTLTMACTQKYDPGIKAAMELFNCE